MTRLYKSDAQANAEALARRTTSYADEHAASWQVRFGAPTHELSTKALVARITENLEAETPERLHEGPDHIDAGGVPAMTAAFLAYLGSSRTATVEKPDPDGIVVGTYRRPQAAAIESMLRCTGKVAWWGRIVVRVIYGGEIAAAAAIAEGSHPYEAKRTANEALGEALRRWTPDKMHLAKRSSAA
jgi:hypothetical protein